MSRFRIAVITCATVCYLLLAVVGPAASSGEPLDLNRVAWPEGTEILPFDDVEGAILVRATLGSPALRDTSGADAPRHGRRLPRDRSRVVPRSSAFPTARPARRPWTWRRGPCRGSSSAGSRWTRSRPCSRWTPTSSAGSPAAPVLGLLGQSLLRDRVVILDYASGRWLVLPARSGPGAGRRSASTRPSRRGRSRSPSGWSETGRRSSGSRVGGRGGRREANSASSWTRGRPRASSSGRPWTVGLPGWRSWPALRGLGAPTLTGDARAEIVRVPMARGRARPVAR